MCRDDLKGGVLLVLELQGKHPKGCFDLMLNFIKKKKAKVEQLSKEKNLSEKREVSYPKHNLMLLPHSALLFSFFSALAGVNPTLVFCIQESKY